MDPKRKGPFTAWCFPGTQQHGFYPLPKHKHFLMASPEVYLGPRPRDQLFAISLFFEFKSIIKVISSSIHSVLRPVSKPSTVLSAQIEKLMRHGPYSQVIHS